MIIWQKENKVDIILKVLLFLISPFFSAIYALRNIKTKSSFVIFFLFAVFFGMAFSVPSGKTKEIRFDGAAYRSKFDQHIKYFKDFDFQTAILKSFATPDTTDSYFVSLSHIVSQYTANYHVLFMLMAMVFAFFALKTMKIFVLEEKFSLTVGGFILLYLFMMNDIFNINGVRFWTAAWVGVYCVFQIFRYDKKRYFILAALTPLIHIAFVVYLIVLIGAFFVKKSHRPWIILFFFSFLISNLSVYLVQSLVDRLPPILSNLANIYTDETNIQKRASSGSGFIWVARIFAFMVTVYLNFLVYLFIKNSKRITSNPKTNRLFTFLLIWMTFVNFAMPIPSLGNRFMILSYPIIAYIWLVNFYNVKYTKVLYIMPIVFVLSFYKKAVLYTGVVDWQFFVSSPFYLTYKYLIIS